jgi:hypothetical protein
MTPAPSLRLSNSYHMPFPRQIRTIHASEPRRNPYHTCFGTTVHAFEPVVHCLLSPHAHTIFTARCSLPLFSIIGRTYFIIWRASNTLLTLLLERLLLSNNSVSCMSILSRLFFSLLTICFRISMTSCGPRISYIPSIVRSTPCRAYFDVSWASSLMHLSTLHQRPLHRPPSSLVRIPFSLVGDVLTPL